VFPPLSDRLPGAAAARAGAGLPLFTPRPSLGRITHTTLIAINPSCDGRELALMVTGLDARQSGTPDTPLGRPELSARERELVILVARIGDKTRWRRRADLTWLALQAALV
jgi:hypothetical protein